jgi:hypothetical protein
MSSQSFSLPFVQDLIDRTAARLGLVEQTGADGGPLLALRTVSPPEGDAGFVRLWAAAPDSLADRMVHFRLVGGPVDTQLFFLFGRSDSAMPHFHAQVVQFSAEACVFNADFLPRLDAVDFPDYIRQVFHPLNKPYWRAINDYANVCSHAPGNPGIAAYLSPWSIGTSRPATRTELEKVAPSIHAYLDHWLDLVTGLRFQGPEAAALRARDARHLANFFDESLDPRAWKGVYAAIGESMGHQIRALLQKSIY